MIVNQDTLEQIFYFILNHVGKQFTPETVAEKLKNNNLEKFYPLYFVENLIRDGWLADKITQTDGYYSLSVIGKAQADLTTGTEVKIFLKMIIDEWSQYGIWIFILSFIDCGWCYCYEGVR